MRKQLRLVLWGSISVKILRGRANYQTLLTEPARGDVRIVLQASYPHGNVYSLGDKVSKALTEICRYVEPRIPAGKLQQRRKHMTSTECRGQFNAHPPDWLLVPRGQKALRFIQFSKHTKAGGEVGLSLIGQREPPGGSVDQLGAEAFFETGDGLTHRTARQSESGASRREASSLRRQHEFVEPRKPVFEHDFRISG
jgi:hypothetical protein